MNRTSLIFLAAIMVLGFFLRFYALGQIPLGLYQDETAIGYNAYSLLHTGKDEHGVSWPLYFKSFGDYKLPVYIYATLFSIKLFGLNAFAVRLPSAFFGIITIPIFYFFIKKLTKNNPLALLSCAILTVNPWHIHYTRATFEVSISLFLFVLGGLFLLQSFDEKKRFRFFLGTLCFVIATYSYNLTRILSPLLFFLFLAWFSRGKNGALLKEKTVSLVAGLLLILPIATSFLGSGGIASARGTLLWSSATTTAYVLGIRSYMISLPPMVTKAIFNMPILIGWQYLTHIAQYLSVPFFFLTGSSHGNHGIGTIGQFYLADLPFFLFGIYLLLTHKLRGRLLLFGWAILTILIASLTREAPHATRSFFLLVPYTVFMAYGMLGAFEKIRKQTKQWQYPWLAGTFLFFALCISWYLSSYYLRFPRAYASNWREGDALVAQYLALHEKEYDKIIFSRDAGFVYSSLLFYLAYSPQDFLQSAIWSPDDSEGFSDVLSFGKYEFRIVAWEKDLNTPRTLIIAKQEEVPQNISPLETVTLPQKPIVLALKEKIVSYPIEEVAYVMVASHP